jgi:hypothetical protein
MRAGKIFFIKKIWWNGRILRQRGFQDWFIWSWQSGRNYWLCLRGKEWAWPKEIDWGFTVRDWDILTVLLGEFTSHVYPSSIKQDNLLFVIGTSSYHRLQAGYWRLTSSSRNRVKKRMLEISIYIYIYLTWVCFFLSNLDHSLLQFFLYSFSSISGFYHLINGRLAAEAGFFLLYALIVE